MSKIIITLAVIVLGYMLFQHFVNNPKAAKANIELGNAFLAENATKDGVQAPYSKKQSESALPWYNHRRKSV